MQIPAAEKMDPISRKNELAYYRALCGRELLLADRDMLAVINELGGGDTEYPITFPGQVCTAAGLISRYTGQQELALETIDMRLENLRLRRDELEFQTDQKLYRLLKSVLVPLNMGLYNDANRAREEHDGFQNELAVLQSVRAMLLVELGRESEAMIARNRVARLGLDASEVVKSLPHDHICLRILEMGQTFMDTRGFVLNKRKKHERAIEDLTIAIAAAEIHLASLDTRVQNLTDMRDMKSVRKLGNNICAVLRNHRLEAYEDIEDVEKANADRARIVELGFQPGRKLF